MSVDDEFTAALRLHQAGHLAEAERGYRRVLKAQPSHADAMHLWGALALQQGNAREAVTRIEMALRIAGPKGDYFANLDPAKLIAAGADHLSIRRHHFQGIGLATFLEALCNAHLLARGPLPPSCHARADSFEPAGSGAVSIARLFECLDVELSDNIAVIADPGDALFGAIDLTIHSRSEFVACAYYASLGFAVPACIALQLAEPLWRPLVLVGDGAFQMTGMELSTAARYGLTPIVVVLDNNGYGTERPMLDGCFNDVHAWALSRIPDIIQSGRGYEVNSEAAFVEALKSAIADTSQLAIIHVHLAKGDISPALERLTKELGRRV